MSPYAAPARVYADYRFHTPTVFAESKVYMSLREYRILTRRHTCEPCLQDFLLTRQRMVLVELLLRTASLLQFTSRPMFRRQ